MDLTIFEKLYWLGTTSEKGFSPINTIDLGVKEGFYTAKHNVDKSVIDAINQRLEIHQIKLSEKEIMEFNSKKIVNKKDVGVNWLK